MPARAVSRDLEAAIRGMLAFFWFNPSFSYFFVSVVCVHFIHFEPGRNCWEQSQDSLLSVCPLLQETERKPRLQLRRQHLEAEERQLRRRRDGCVHRIQEAIERIGHLQLQDRLQNQPLRLQERELCKLIFRHFDVSSTDQLVNSCFVNSAV